jgi:large repetitive protein
VSIEQDSSLEAPVRVNAVPSPTVQNPLELTGSAEPSVEIRIEGGAAPLSSTTDANGQFTVQVQLTANASNTLRVFRLGSTVETVLVVVHDDIAPEAPQLDAIASPTNQTNILVSGTSEPSAHISISGGVNAVNGMAGAAGRFSIQVQIAEDQTTTLTVIATDRAGNTSLASTAMVEHSSNVPDAPILDDASPDPTNEATYVVTGRVASPGPGIDIEIVGGAELASGSTDPLTGSFSVEVTLNANLSNELEVRSVEGEIVSPPALVTIAHDDLAPSAPAANRITVGSPAFPCIGGPIESIGVTGGATAVEGFSRVRVSNLTRNNIQSSTDAAQDGAFTTTILACDGDVLRITATDAAGNTSLPTELTVQ